MFFLIINFIIINSILIVNCLKFPESPCPEIFSYQKIRSRRTSFLKIDNFDPDIQNILKVQCSNWGSPQLKLSGDKDSSIQDLLKKNPIYFELSFQASDKYPEIIDIVSNGRTICQNNNVNYASSGIAIRTHRMGPITWSAESVVTSPRYTSVSSSVTELPFISQTCGTQNVPKLLVLSTKKLNKGSMPWLAIIFRKTKNTNMCTGNLLSENTILTAAHCFDETKNVKSYIIGLGLYDLGRNDEEGAEYKNVKSIIINPQYKKYTIASYADIALVIITNNIQYTRNIMSICLWNSGTDYNSLIGVTGIIPGWGKSDKDNFNIPRLTEAKIVSHNECLTSNPKFNHALSSTSFCAGFRDGTGPCSGDSGSGLVFKSNNEWYLAGIVSQSLNNEMTSTCDLHNFVIYTDVSKFKNWIQQNMQ